MPTSKKSSTAAATNHPPSLAPLTSVSTVPQAIPNRVFAFIYSCAILALFYRHALHLLTGPNTVASAAAAVSLLVADVILAFTWLTAQLFRLSPVQWKEYPDNLGQVFRGSEDFPALDVFVCTADPYKEPPLGVVNTVLSVMAYEYPAYKVSVYVSDDGGSELTLFAFMEAAKFAREWLPFCRQNKLVDRSPDAYFSSNPSCMVYDHDNIKMMYEKMKVRIENVMEMGKVENEYLTHHDKHKHVLRKWTDHSFTKQNHPAVVQVLVDSKEDKDTSGNRMPNLIYVSREKNKDVPHHFKAGALNALLRVSALFTNAPIVLTLDCDTRSTDPTTPRRVLCHLYEPTTVTNPSDIGYVQFPQLYQGINKSDIYGGEYKRLFRWNPRGMRNGPSYVGTGCFFSRRLFFGGPTTFIAPEIPQLSPGHNIRNEHVLSSQEILELAHQVARCSYEDNTCWGSKIGFRYGSLVEDYFTGYRLQCEGWKSRFSDPDQGAFIGDSPISLIESLTQTKRWDVGLLEVAFSRFSTMTFGLRYLGPYMGLCYAHYSFWPISFIPIAIYAFVPQVALICSLSIFPKVSESGFFLYLFLFIGAYAQDLADFIIGGHIETIQRWWNDQRMWLIRGLTSHPFGIIEYCLKLLGISGHGFDVTSKISNDEQSKKYKQGVFEFGASSPMFVLLSIAATVNLMSLVHGLVMMVFMDGGIVQGLVLQIMLVGYGVVNGWPVYEAMFLRRDKGKMPTIVTLASVFVASLVYSAAALVAKPN